MKWRFWLTDLEGNNFNAEHGIEEYHFGEIENCIKNYKSSIKDVGYDDHPPRPDMVSKDGELFYISYKKKV